MTEETQATTEQSDANKAIRRQIVIMGATAGFGPLIGCTLFGGLSILDSMLLSLIVSGTFVIVGSATAFYVDVLRGMDSKQATKGGSISAVCSLILASLSIILFIIPILGFIMAIFAYWLGLRSRHCKASMASILAMGISLVAMVLAPIAALISMLSIMASNG